MSPYARSDSTPVTRLSANAATSKAAEFSSRSVLRRAISARLSSFSRCKPAINTSRSSFVIGSPIDAGHGGARARRARCPRYEHDELKRDAVSLKHGSRRHADGRAVVHRERNIALRFEPWRGIARVAQRCRCEADDRLCWNAATGQNRKPELRTHEEGQFD